MAAVTDVEGYLERNGIDCVRYEHEPVATCEEAERSCGHIEGMSCKNLFLSDVKGGRFVLAVLPADARADFRMLARAVGERKLTFAREEELSAILGLRPGSVSVFGLINDEACRVSLLLDSRVAEAETVKFHPNRNTATLQLSGAMFKKYLELVRGSRSILIV